MKYRIVPVKNISRLKAAGDALLTRPPGMPGMGMVTGVTGAGKTTGTTWFVNQCHGVYVRAMAMWSPKTMLATLARELDLPDVRKRNNAELVEGIVQRLTESGRPIFIDEADYVVERRQLVDTLRDVHDLSTVPVILIGMQGLDKRIRGNAQFTGRIAQWVVFEGLDLEDATLLAGALAEVRVEADLIAGLHEAASPKDGGGAEVRRLVVGLGNIEGYARARGMDAIGLADWPKGRGFFVGAPVSAAAGAVRGGR